MTSESSLSCSSDLSSESECSLDSYEYVSAVEENSISEFLPYDENVEPIAREEEIERYEEEVAREEQENGELMSRFSGEIGVNSWLVYAVFVATFHRYLSLYGIILVQFIILLKISFF